MSGLFVDPRLGPIAGTLPLDAINMAGGAVTPQDAAGFPGRTVGLHADVASQ